MATATVQNPNKIVCTLQFTMALEDWKQVRATLGKNRCYSEIQVINEIDDLVKQLEQVFYTDNT